MLSTCRLPAIPRTTIPGFLSRALVGERHPILFAHRCRAATVRLVVDVAPPVADHPSDLGNAHTLAPLPRRDAVRLAPEPTPGGSIRPACGWRETIGCSADQVSDCAAPGRRLIAHRTILGGRATLLAWPKPAEYL
jgi:hypothetical protein